MAKNREPAPKPADSSETDDELVSDSEPDSGSDSDSEPQTQPPTKSPVPPPAVSNSSHSESVADSDSDTDSSESDPPPKKPDPPKSKPTPTPSAGVKRPPAKAADVQDSKKAKKAEPLSKKDGKSESTSEDVSKKLFQRVFSDEDEIVLLNGMLDFIAKKKSDPIAGVDEFLEFVKKLKMFNFDVTRAQLLNKMKRLKVKYENNASKDKKLSKEHEKEAYALSKSIWGGKEGDKVEAAKGNGNVAKKNKNVGAKVSNEVDDKTVVVVEEESGDKKLKGVVGVGSSGGGSNEVDVLYLYSALEKRVMSDEIKYVDKEKRKELDNKLKEIEVAELELFAKRCEYMAEKARLIVAAKKA